MKKKHPARKAFVDDLDGVSVFYGKGISANIIFSLYIYDCNVAYRGCKNYIHNLVTPVT